MMMDDRRVMFHDTNGNELSFDVRVDRLEVNAISSKARVRTWGSSNDVYLRETYPEAIAILNAVLNPPGPGDVTVRGVERALPNGHTATIYHQHGKDVRCPPIILCHTGGCNDGKPVACARNHDGDILATIASLKPAPDPRDELQESHAELLDLAKRLHRDVHDISTLMPDLIARAEKLTKEPTE